MSQLTPQEIGALLQAWKERAHTQGYKPGTKTYAKLEIEFFVGAFSMLAAQGRSYPPIWNVIIMSGRSLSETLSPDKEARHD